MSKPLRLKVEVYITDRDDVVCVCVSTVTLPVHTVHTVHTTMRNIHNKVRKRWHFLPVINPTPSTPPPLMKGS